ncbi:uncharacterized protein LOC130648151 [Hydractinia symbiolongicarpus]|uniref:uncharacterized protein LOC130648151 n=1 Tax=Hydractinia symbiolongicarpus TaxID=13093 RepID=UPI00254EB156|nr:uncharacterized protein LOC130648151 [Hydractinia symbiolongicarpus]
MYRGGIRFYQYFTLLDENLSVDDDSDYEVSSKETQGSDSDNDFKKVSGCKEIANQNGKRLNSQRMYTLWSEESKDAFDVAFADHLKKERGYPSRGEMEEFAKQFDFNIKQVRTRIVNLRRLRLHQQQVAKNHLGICG